MGSAISSPVTFSPRAGFFYALAFLAMIAACLAMPRILSFLPAVIGLAGVAWLRAKNGSFPAFDKTLGAFFTAIVVWGLISSYWAVDTAYSAERALKIAGILIPSLALLAAARSMPSNTLYKERIPVIAACICILAASLLFFEFYSKFLLTRSVIGMKIEDMPENMHNGFVLNRSTVLLVVSLIPVTYLVWTSGLAKKIKYLCLGVLYAVTGGLLFEADSQTAQIAALFAILMMFFPAHRKKARMILLGVVLVLMASAPFFIKPLYDGLLPSMQNAFVDDLRNLGTWDKFLRRASVPHRLEVWNFASEKISERPLFGWGVDSMRFLKSDHVMENMGTDSVLHPHNAVLQIWLEFGAFGIAIAMGLVVLIFRRIGALQPLEQRYATLLFIVLLSILSTGYGLWQAWLLGMLNAITAMNVMAVRLNSKN